MTHYTDQEIIDRTLEGDTAIFAALVERYQYMVYTVVYRIVRNKEEAEEIAQDSFVKAYQSLGTYKGKSKFSSWLYTIAYRKSLDRVRNQSVTFTTSVIDNVSEKALKQVENALDYMESKEQNEIVLEAIMKLPEKESVIVTLYYLEENSVKEIAAIVGISPQNVKIKLYRARKKLYSLLKDYVSPEIKDRYGRAL
ncbi:RNA polymerase sigma factor [Aquimarina hainanensis]|uniref:RNA polymerase sigma factor n=1 Tax=Aquimarina hainanensis TaxID=1578017 RepID=A0ABW5N310_9FLAO